MKGSREIGLALLLVAGLHSCTFEPGDPSTGPSSPSPETSSIPAVEEGQEEEDSRPSLPPSEFASGCARDQRRLNRQFTALLDKFPTTREEARQVFQEIAEIAYFLALNAGAMEQELREEGPVRKGDDCLYGGALGLKIIAQVFPEGHPNRTKTEQQSVRFFRILLDYYPDSRWADTAREALDELT
jgi:hypothetical protein